jgi:serine protease Do
MATASPLTAVQEAARTTLSTVSPSVVTIGRSGRGTGLVIAPGQVVTCAHNLRDRTTQVTFADGSTAQATVHGLDADGDLVVLAVETGANPAVTWASVPAAPGDAVFALGRGQIAFGLVGSADASFRGPGGRVVAGALQHSAPVARGGSGGPVVNLAGQVVGVNTHRLNDGFYLASPAGPALQERLARLGGGQHIERRRLGVALAPAQAARRIRQAAGLPSVDGLLIAKVGDGSVAAAAGLRRGDVIVGAAGVPLDTADALAAALDHLDGDVIELAIVRGTDELTVSVNFAVSTVAETDETSEPTTDA